MSDTKNIFVVSDHHFGHTNMLKMESVHGGPLRPFTTLEEMHETLIQHHNQVVRPCDKVYFLGDVCLHKTALGCISRLNGDKVLIKGNHDQFKIKWYLKDFRDVRSYQQMPGPSKKQGYVLSHIPLHRDMVLERYQGGNVHGHLHEKVILKPDGSKDPLYFCASLEQHDYFPVAWEEIEAALAVNLTQEGAPT